MQTLYLVRHGESTQNTGINKQQRIPDHAVPLTETGKQQAHAAGEFLSKLLAGVPENKIAIWISPYSRTRATAAGILEYLAVGSKKEDALLTELQFGIFDAISKEEAQRLFPREWESFQNARRFNGKFYARRPGGESPFDCEIRQRLWLDTLFRDINNGCKTEHFIIVGHGAQLNILRKAIFHYTHEWYAEAPNPGNCSIMKVVLDNGKNQDLGYIYGKPAE